MLLLDTGARRTELADLQLTHVDLTWTCCWCSARAATSTRCLPIVHKVGEALERDLRARHKHADLPWLWINRLSADVPR
jgi:integrase